MKIKNLPQDTEDEEDDIPVNPQLEDRKKDYAEYKYVRKQLGKLYQEVEQAYDDKYEQTEIINDGWDVYNCVLSEKQAYSGKSQIYVPIVHDAINARVTRFINMLFPQNGRQADVVGDGEHVPYDTIALLDHYVRQAKLRSLVMPGVIRSGDISGNYALYIEWGVKSRFIVNKVQTPEHVTELGTAVEGSETYEDVEYEEVKEEHPVFSILDTRNVVFLPATAASPDDAEATCVILRYTETKIREMIDEGVFEKEPAEELIRNMGEVRSGNRVDTGKKALGAAGVRKDSKGNKTALIYQVWKKLKIKGQYRMMVSHFAGEDLFLGCKRNPFWNDRVPVLFQAVEKEDGSIYGKSQVDSVKQLQYAANDAVNMGFDSAQYSLLPIIMTDPVKNPNVGSLVLTMASVWLVDPASTKFAEFPQIWKEAFAIVGSAKEQIFQSLGVNPAMIPHGHGAKKPTQAQIAQEQTVMLATTSNEVSLLEDFLSQALEWMYDLDYQYRTKEITVRKYGQLGLQATMQQVKTSQTRTRLWFRWYGLESFKAAQQIQQMISWGATLMKMPPQALNGRKVDLGPMLEYITEAICGPKIAPRVLIDQRYQLSMPPEQENALMQEGFPVQTHPVDDDPAHLQEHFTDYKTAPNEYKKGHILEHMKQMKAKAMAQEQQAVQPPAPGGGDRIGAQKEMPTGAQNPPGAVHKDGLHMTMPRKSL